MKAPTKNKSLNLLLTEYEIRNFIRQTYVIQILTEADKKKVPKIPDKSTLQKIYDAIEAGGQGVYGFLEGAHDIVMKVLKTAAKGLGFQDPCEYIKNKRELLEKEADLTEEALETLQEAEEPGLGITNLLSILEKMGKGSILMALLSSLKSLPTLAKSVATNIASPGGAWAMVKGDSAMAHGFGAMDSNQLSSVADASKIFGLTAANWGSIGAVTAILGAAIIIYKLLLASGGACTIAKIAGEIKSAMGSVVKGAFDVAKLGLKVAMTPIYAVGKIAKSVVGWGTNLIKTFMNPVGAAANIILGDDSAEETNESYKRRKTINERNYTRAENKWMRTNLKVLVLNRALMEL